MKRCSTSLAIRKIQIKTITIYNFFLFFFLSPLAIGVWFYPSGFFFFFSSSSSLLLFCHCFLFSFSLLFSFSTPHGLWDLGSCASDQAWAPEAGALSPNCWNNREHQVPGNINWSEVSQRSTSQHQDLVLFNCLQTSLLETSGQITSETGT